MKAKIKSFTPAIVLGLICLTVAALLATINHFTKPVIDENERLARTESLRAVFGGESSGADFGDAMTGLPDFGEDSSVSEIYEEIHGMGYAVVLTVKKGFEGEIGLTVGVDRGGKVTGVVITKYDDSLGKDKMPEAVKNFVGLDSADGVELVSGATYSSNAVRAAVADALSAVRLVRASAGTAALTSLEESGTASLGYDEILGEAKAMLAGAEDFEFSEEITKREDGAAVPAYRVRIYKETAGRGYAALGETYNPYAGGAVESSFVFVLDKSFKIKDFKLLSWSLSPSYQEDVNIYLDDPAVKRLEESFVGADRMSFSVKVDLVTEATVTSVRIREAVSDTLVHLDRNHETKVKAYKVAGVAVLLVGISALAVGICMQRRRRK